MTIDRPRPGVPRGKKAAVIAARAGDGQHLKLRAARGIAKRVQLPDARYHDLVAAGVLVTCHRGRVDKPEDRGGPLFGHRVPRDELAEALGVTPQHLSTLVHEGILPRDPDGLFRVVDTLPAYSRHLQDRKAAKAGWRAVRRYRREVEHFEQSHMADMARAYLELVPRLSADLVGKSESEIRRMLEELADLIGDRLTDECDRSDPHDQAPGAEGEDQ